MHSGRHEAVPSAAPHEYERHEQQLLGMN
jgi:hypothetical protein